MLQGHDVTRAGKVALILVCLAIGIQVPVNLNLRVVPHAEAQSNKNRSDSTSKGSAPARKPSAPTTVDPCAVAAAHATLTLGPGVSGVQAVSNGNDYYSKDCAFYIVDITVPSDSSAPGFLPSFTIESGAVDLKNVYPSVENASSGTNYAGGFAVPTHNACHIYHQETRIFARNSSANEFTLLSAVKVRGGLDDNPANKCSLVAEEPGKGVPGYGLPFGSQPSKSSTKVYPWRLGSVWEA